MRAACGGIMVFLARNFLADYYTSGLRGVFSCKINGLYRELQPFIRCLGVPAHDDIFAFCRAAPCSVRRTDPGRALAPGDARSGDSRGPAPAVLDAGAGDLARA